MKYRIVYTITGFFTTRRFEKAKQNHKYAILVAARNEATVIGNLLDSIHQQDYPSDLIRVFVVADNCTDNTAEIARKNGAVCYERFDSEHRTKGYALQFLVEEIRRDYGIDAFEGYLIFDADNLLKQDYLRHMNDSFDSGERIVTSYRNTKNFGDNWIAASYGVHWLRTIRFEHRARGLFRLATRIQGTGFLFSSEVIKNGWNYTSLTEDRAFCADAVANGWRISYNNKAEFFDEQPTDIKIAMRQRIRWAKGHIQAFFETGPKLFWHIFKPGISGDRVEEEKNAGNEISRSKRFFYNIRLRFMSFDMLTTVYPRPLFSGLKKYILILLRGILIFQFTEQIVSNNFAPAILKRIFVFNGIDFSTLTAPGKQFLWIWIFWFANIMWSYLRGIFVAAYIYIVEHKRIPKIKWYKKIWYCITFPMFDVIGRISLYIALFKKVEWKPIPHNASVTISEITGKPSRKEKQVHH